MKNIAQRERRNRISSVLREVEAGSRMRVTVDGRPVAELLPLEGARRTFVPREDLVTLLRQAPLDREFARDIAAIDATIAEL